jgi:hypothetical protein
MTPAHPDDLLMTLPILGLGLTALVVTLGLMLLVSRHCKVAQTKGDALLRSWLSSEQGHQWDSHGHFEAIGSHTGRRYRLRRGKEMNVDELDSEGKIVAQWCFAPLGNLVIGDVVLAQKLALETMESEALRIANRRPH